MGLDMYLERRHYVKNWGSDNKENKFTITVKKGGKKFEAVNRKNIKYIIEDVGYWRKANHIHKWFVENVQEGEDNCKDYYVSRDSLKELLAICHKVVNSSKLVKGEILMSTSYENGKETPNYEEGKVIANPEVAEELLPTTKGFFFGGTDYDEYYLRDIEETIKIIEEVLKTEEGDIYYQSSW